MDPSLEKGDLSSSTRTTGRSKCSAVCVLSSLVTLTLAISLAALALSAVSYWEGQRRLQQQEQEGRREVKLVIEDAHLEVEGLKQLEGLFAEEEHMQRYQDVDKRQAGDDSNTRTDETICESTDLERKPLAHVVPGNGGSKMRTHTMGEYGGQYSVLTEDWKCTPDARNPSAYGRVHGGMAFNKTTGFLRLPVDGIYFVYSQIVFKIDNLDVPFSIKHQTVACIPNHGCTSPDSGATQTYVETVDRYLGNVSQDAESTYHGTLLHFPAGTQVALVTFKPEDLLSTVRSDRDVFVDATWHRTFMGAFLVESIPFL